MDNAKLVEQGRKLLAASTKGPWVAGFSTDDDFEIRAVMTADGVMVCDTEHCLDAQQERNNIIFTAWAHENLAALLDAAEEATRLREALVAVRNSALPARYKGVDMTNTDEVRVFSARTYALIDAALAEAKEPV